MIVDNVEIIQANLPVGKTLTWDKVKMFVGDAEDDLKKVIGKTFYDEIDADSSTGTPMEELKKKLQSSISYYAYWLGFEIMNATFSNQGIHRIESEQGGKKALFQRQEENLKLTFKRTGQNKLDGALEYMEDNKISFPTWVASPEYTLLRLFFINSTSVFSSLYFINNSRLVFLKLRSYQTMAEDFDIISLIGRAFFDELKTQIKTDALTPENAKFVNLLQKAVAPLTIYHGAYSLLVNMTELGVIKIEDDATAPNFRKKTQTEYWDKIISDAKKTGDNYIKTCAGFLKENITDYPTYADSDAYDESISLYDGVQGTDKILVI